MEADTIYSQISRLGVVPVIAIDNPDCALPLADALVAGGLPIIEITFRTAAAAPVIELLSRERPHVLVGAGTVLTLENLHAAKKAGARFALAPGLNPEIVRGAQAVGLPFVPGIATPSEIEQALGLGCSTLKFFPATQMGGVSMINALAGPYSHMGVRFLPTGGINLTTLESYLACKAVAAVGGTWIAPKEVFTSGKWMEIQRRCAETVEIVRRVRASKA
jgi:2-dehydro-3-deoxyphosphogluconate aldolase / (4S)-4-hydroxy-2-oxoglutarate aldolase